MGNKLYQLEYNVYVQKTHFQSYFGQDLCYPLPSAKLSHIFVIQLNSLDTVCFSSWNLQPLKLCLKLQTLRFTLCPVKVYIFWQMPCIFHHTIIQVFSALYNKEFSTLYSKELPVLYFPTLWAPGNHWSLYLQFCLFHNVM